LQEYSLSIHHSRVISERKFKFDNKKCLGLLSGPVLNFGLEILDKDGDKITRSSNISF
jgi:hypothetical protein